MNPYLSLFEYVPDGEPHVFGDRLYIYGSHDRAGGISVRIRGTARGRILIRTGPNGPVISEIHVRPAKAWTEFAGRIKAEPGTYPICICYQGRGKLELSSFTLS